MALTAKLTWRCESRGLAFGLTGGDGPLPVSDWSRWERVEAVSGKAVHVGPLLRLRDDGVAEERASNELVLPWAAVARLTSQEVRSLGLPRQVEFSLEVRGSGAIADADFEVSCGLLHRDGRRVVGVKRVGARLRIGAEEYLLPDPLYTIVDRIDRFAGEVGGIEGRMLAWGQIAELLPKGALVDDHLKSLHIAVASCFTLRPFVNDRGEPDFDPLLGRQAMRLNEYQEDERFFEECLPPARQKDFARRFRGLSKVKHRYTVGAGTFVVLSPEAEHTLRAVRRAQDGTPAERRDFLLNASGYLREALTEGGASDVELDAVFHDEGLSERVEGIGIWVPKVLPWVKLAREPWLPPEEFGLQIGDQIVRISSEEIPEILDRVRDARTRGEREIRHGAATVPVGDEAIAALEGLLPEIRPEQGKQKPPEGAPGQAEPTVLLIADNLDEHRFHLAPKPRQGTPGRTPAILRATLLPHQQEGLRWLQDHWCAGSHGALLADDMGLGKTVEALAFLAWLREEFLAEGVPRRPLLVVAPTGLLQNWQDEHRKHLDEPGLGEVVATYGSGLRRLRHHLGNELTHGAPTLDIEALSWAPWVITTYETLRDYQHSFGRVHWRAAVFDEAQKIKNPGIRLTEAALAMNIDFAITMTGTPVENRPADIWTIIDRAEPGWLGTLREFSHRYERESDESELDSLHRRLTQETPPRAPAIMLRRLKEGHLVGLPDKVIHTYPVEMPPVQAKSYKDAVLAAQKGETALTVLHRIRSISLHPYAPGAEEIERYILGSARLTETFRILDEVALAREKALIFVEARSMQDFLIEALRRRYSLPEDVLVINGAVSGKVRKKRVDLFQDRHGFDVMVLSPRAGGVGLNLTAARHVIHLARWWNPAVEDQCTDRVYRIGQEHTVHIHYPIARHPTYGDHSFDVKLDALLTRKRELNRRVLAPTAASNEDVDALFRATVEEVRSDAPADDGAALLRRIDQMEPIAFERWVLRRLAEAGYDVNLTPYQDCGADGLAISRFAGKPHSLLLQCKHTQEAHACNHHAVEEVVGARALYMGRAEGPLVLLVVTNAPAFTTRATALAQQHGVRLVGRPSLGGLQSYRPDPEE